MEIHVEVPCSLFADYSWNRALEICVAFPIPIIVALLLNELRIVIYKRTIQTIIYMPHFLSWVIIGGIAVGILSPSTGIVNQFIKWLGFEPIYFLAENSMIRSVLVTSGIWKELGWGTTPNSSLSL